MPRIFIALPVSSEVQDAIVRWRAEAAPSVVPDGWRWVSSEQYHITLKFLGNIAESQVDPVADAAGVAVTEWRVGRERGGAVSPLRLVARGIGAFPAPKKARVLWIGVTDGEADDGAKGLLALQRCVDTRLIDLGFAGEPRAFVPHITVARTRVNRALREEGRTYEKHSFGRWRPEAMHIIESRLGPDGPRYTVRHAVSL